MKTIQIICHSVLLLAAAALLVTTLPLRASDLDSRIESAAKQSYVFRAYLQGDNIKIESHDGAVVLTGSVASESHKSMAEDTVADLPGVRSVDNQMTVSSEPAQSSRTVGEKIDDSSITTQVKIALLFHKSTSAIHTKVKTRNGVVTVRGTAQNRAERRLVTKIVKDIHGVLGVNNKMTIESGK